VPVEYIITPTGDELPEMEDHWARLEAMLGQDIKRLDAPTLQGEIDRQNALPNFHQRWCTRLIKIEPCEKYLQTADGILCVGLRADEPTRMGAVYGDLIQTRTPLREWGWGIGDVMDYLDERGVSIPHRTDCARCFFQRIGEWYRLWVEHPWLFEQAVQDEERLQNTLRTPGKDAWPVRLKEMREAFQMGRKPEEAKKREGMKGQGALYDLRGLGVEEYGGCRVCSL